MPRFVLPVLLFALLACGFRVGSPTPKVVVTGPPRPPPPIQTYIAMTKTFEGMDAAAEVDGALRRGDRRLIGIGGQGGVIPPGVEDYMQRWEYYEREYGVRWVPYTSDTIDSDEQVQMQSVAWRFAERYNRLLLQRTSAGTRPATAPVR